jgi:transposase
MIAFAVGIDVSKMDLDVGLLHPNGQLTRLHVPNTPAGHTKLLAKARKAAGDCPLHFCMEATGPYHWVLALRLVAEGELVSVENPRRIRHYALSEGREQKTDRADAKVIALYAREKHPKPWRLAEPHLRELVMLDRRITDLTNLRTQESNRLELPTLTPLIKQGIRDSMELFQSQIAQLERRIQELLEENEELARQVELLKTIPGIAERAAIGVLAEAGDLDDFLEAKDLAARFGLNPKLRRSGSSVHGKTRISKAGSSHARARLYMPAVTATKCNPIIRDFYLKLVASHHPKKAAIIAAERKLVMICYGVLKSQKPFDPNHKALTS